MPTPPAPISPPCPAERHSGPTDRRQSRWSALLALIMGVFLALGATVPEAAQASLLHLEGPPPADLGLHQEHLSPCPAPAHCAREDWSVADPAAALERLLPAVLALEGVEIVETGSGYIHATATSRLFGFVDDLELHAAPANGVIEARSLSRIGDSDLGVNGRRLATLRRALDAS
jgi:uncharacterized protein (DUF1499 family)